MLQVFSWFGILKYSGPIRTATLISVVDKNSRSTTVPTENIRFIDVVDGDRTLSVNYSGSRFIAL